MLRCKVPEIHHDYKFGHGRDVIKNYFKGKTLIVDGEKFARFSGSEFCVGG